MVNLSFNGHFPEVSSQIPGWYSRNVLREVKEGSPQDSAKRRIDVRGITIDKLESKDLDDGIWAYQKPNGNYVMQVSITDVAELIPVFSALDFSALDRTTSIYLDTHVIHMFPKEIASDRGSLNHQTTRVALTVEIELNKDFETVRADFFESRFFNMHRHDHFSFFKDINNPASEFHHTFRLIHQIAQWLYYRRFDWLRIKDFEEADRSIQMGTTTFWDTDKNISSFVVQEFMIKANIEAAKLMVRESVNGVFRNHMPQLKDYEGELPKDLERALYESAMKFHLWLSEDFYCHFTSPLRRYADLIVHRQLKRFLRNQQEVYSPEEVERLCTYINSQITALLELQKVRSVENKWIRIYRKVKKKNGIVEPSDIKWHIKYHAIYGNKIPEITRKVIIESIQNSPQVPDWIMIVMLWTKDKEIISLIKEKVLWDIKIGRYYRILQWSNALNFTEEVTEDEWRAKVHFKVFVWEVEIYSTKRNVTFPRVQWVPQKQRRGINAERAKARKKGLWKFFDYLLEEGA